MIEGFILGPNLTMNDFIYRGLEDYSQDDSLKMRTAGYSAAITDFLLLLPDVSHFFNPSIFTPLTYI